MKKKIIFFLFLVFNILSFSKYEDGNYSIKKIKDKETLTLNLRVRNGEVISFDFDKIDSTGKKLSTKSSDFRKERDLIKEYIKEKKSFDKEVYFKDLKLNVEFKEMLDILNNNSKPGEYEF